MALDLFHNLKEKLVCSLLRREMMPPRVVHSTPTHFAVVSEEDRELWDKFEAWMVEYEKSYESVAEKERFEIFKECVREMEEHNAANKLWKQGLNQFSDLTLPEFKCIYGCSLTPLEDDEFESSY